jgi:2'-5' RNA ligase
MADRPLRLFVALEIPAAWRDGLEREIARVARLDPRARVVPARNVHVTLAFLGATPEGRVVDVVRAMRSGSAGLCAPLAALEGLGAFPSASRPRVLWAGLREEGGARLEAAARSVGEALRAAGFELEEHERFHAHVTLARLAERPAAALEKVLTAGRLQGTYKPEMLSDLVLMVSEPTSDGSRYRALERVLLPAPTSGGETSTSGRVGDSDSSPRPRPRPGASAPGRELEAGGPTAP